MILLGRIINFASSNFEHPWDGFASYFMVIYQYGSGIDLMKYIRKYNGINLVKF